MDNESENNCTTHVASVLVEVDLRPPDAAGHVPADVRVAAAAVLVHHADPDVVGGGGGGEADAGVHLDVG